jgi:hypothetical protein
MDGREQSHGGKLHDELARFTLGQLEALVYVYCRDTEQEPSEAVAEYLFRILMAARTMEVEYSRPDWQEWAEALAARLHNVQIVEVPYLELSGEQAVIPQGIDATDGGPRGRLTQAEPFHG